MSPTSLKQLSQQQLIPQYIPQNDYKQNQQREIRSPLETMRFGKRSDSDLYGITQYKKREENNPFSTMRFGKRNEQNPLGIMRFGKRNIKENNPLSTMRFGKRNPNFAPDVIQYSDYSSPLQIMRFGK